MNVEKLAQIYKDQGAQASSDLEHQSLLNSNAQISGTIISTTKTLIDYLQGSTGKVQVVNQLRSIGTPDAFKVVQAVDDLHNTLKTHENVDLSELTQVMGSILEEAKKIPKELPEHKEAEVFDYSPQLKSLAEGIKAVEKVIKAQKLIAEAPVVNVAPTDVKVDAPDLKPLQTAIKAVVSAVNKIVIPEYKTDNKAVEELLKKSNKLLKEIVEKPVGGGGGGGGRVSPYQTGVNAPAFVTLEADGSIPVTSNTVNAYGLVQFDDTSSASYEYYAYMNASSSWYIKRLTVATNLFEFTVPVATTYSAGWTGRAGLTYLEKGAAF